MEEEIEAQGRAGGAKQANPRSVGTEKSGT